VRPEASVMVPEIITGRRRPRSSKQLLDGEQRRLGVQRVEDGLDQQQVGAALDQAAAASCNRHQLVEGDVAEAGVVHVRRDRGRCARSARARRRRSAACPDPCAVYSSRLARQAAPATFSS
jgi:hypothetical protein